MIKKESKLGCCRCPNRKRLNCSLIISII